jgi:hypothetical protein
MAFKVRFNLGTGVNFMKWRIENLQSGEVIFLDPKETKLQLTDCKLKNQKATAKKINSGAHKEVCAWIICKEVVILPETSLSSGEAVSYNPRVTPNWVFKGENADNRSFCCLHTVGNKIFEK